MFARLIRWLVLECVDWVLAVVLFGGFFLIVVYTSFNMLLCIIASGSYATVTLVAFFKMSRLIEKEPNALTGHCAECGYNLRTLPRRGRCPECGSQYNTRTVVLDGVFTAGMLEFPAGNLLGTALATILLVLFIAWGLRPVVVWRLGFALIFGVLGALYVRSTWKRLGRYLRFRGIVQRINQDAEG